MSQDFKYLAIKNWAKYQSGKKNWDWVKDYVNQNDDKELGELSLFERGLLQELRRLRGRSGKNIPNDVTHIASAIHAKNTDRARIGNALQTLIEQNVLILTDQQDDFIDKNRVDEIRREKGVTKDLPEAPAKQPTKPKPIRAEASSALKAVLYLPLNNGDEFGISEEDFTLWKSLYPAVDVMQQLRNMVGWCHANVKKRKTRDGIKRFITSWLSKAQDNPKAAKTYTEGGNGQPKSEQREKRNDEKYARIEQRIAGIPESLGTALPGGVGGSGNRDVDSRPKLLSLGRSAGSG